MNRNRKLKKMIAAAMCMTLTAGTTVPAAAARQYGKDENVYVNLNQDGSVSNIYVVNEYVLDEDSKITDYGNYSVVKNLSSEDEISNENGTVTVNAPKGKFFYQGELKDAVLPWKIQILYKLDGKEVTADELAGKNGKLEIIIRVKDNTESDDEFFDSYLMQGSLTLNTDQCSNIKAEGATQANVGKNRQLLYNIMAGQEKEFVISADVTDFEMDAVSFQAVPMSFDIDSDSLDRSSLTEKTDEIKDAAKEFDDGAVELDDGAGELLDGVKELKDGVGDLKDGAKELKDGTGELVSGSSELVTGAKELSSGAVSLKDGMGSLSDGACSLNNGIKSVDSGAASIRTGASQLSSGAGQAAQGSRELRAGAYTLADNLQTMQKGADELEKGLDQLIKKSPELTEGSAQVLAALKQIQKSLTSVEVGTAEMQNLLESSQKILEGIQSAQAGAGQVSEGLAAVQGNYGTIDSLTVENSNAAQYLRGLAGMASSMYASLPADMVEQYTAGIDVYGTIGNVENIAGLLEQNNAAFYTITGAVDQAAAGVAGVQEGLTQLSSQYTLFNEQIQSLPVILDEMIKENMGELKAGIDQLVKEYKILDKGINAYTEGVSEIKAGYDQIYNALPQVTNAVESLADGAGELNSGTEELYNGTVDLLDGVEELYDGVSELKDGTKELQDGTKEFVDKTDDIDSKIDEEIDKAIDDIAGGDYKPVSFVSEKNKNVELVQFVMKTEAITIPEEEESEEEPEEESVLEKFIKFILIMREAAASFCAAVSDI